MRLDLNQYRSSLDKMRPQFLAHKGDPYRKCVELSVVSHIPVLACILYALLPGVLGEVAVLRQATFSLISFYHYSEILDWNSK